MAIDPDIRWYYDLGAEAGRLQAGEGLLEALRTRALLAAWLPPPPAVVLDVGGGTGPHARWLVERGYETHLVDAMEPHVARARREAPGLASAEVGDARKLSRPSSSADAVLLLGPLYHLTERADRVTALAEARRVVRPGGVVAAAGISRYASLLAGVAQSLVEDPEFRAILARDLEDGQHRNATRQPQYFTTAYFHLPHELESEARDAGLEPAALLAVEGPGWLAADLDARLRDEGRRRALLDAIALVEAEPALLAMSAHLLLFARPR
jgi:ubiquinone/menaquinone biosynthesis C-methylase UbiE